MLDTTPAAAVALAGKGGARHPRSGRGTGGDTGRAVGAARDIELICANPDRVVQRGDQLIYCGGSLADLRAVRAMVGGKDYVSSIYNRATQAQRQPGSAFKPFVYAAALDNGYTPASIVQDSPITIEAGPGQEAWSPSNYDGKSGGPHTLRYGIEHSKNLMTVRLAKDVGMPLIAEYARRFGVYDDLLPVLPMSLGAGETTVMRRAEARFMESTMISCSMRWLFSGAGCDWMMNTSLPRTDSPERT